MHDERRLYNHDERRLHARTRIFRSAQLFAETRIGCCVVRNISAVGAGLTMVSTASIPVIHSIYHSTVAARFDRVALHGARRRKLVWSLKEGLFVPFLIDAPFT